MRRREFITLVGSTVATWPLAARAQQPAKIPKIGFLGANSPSNQREWTGAFVQRLRELGWIEGNTVAIEYRWAEGKFARSPEFVAELLRLNLDVIVTHATPNILAAKRATSTVPIVFAVAGDPVENKIVQSLSRPGGNVTGLSMQQAEIAGKRLELLREVIPDLRRLAVMTRVDNPNLVLETEHIRAAATKLGLEIDKLEIGRLEDIEAAIPALKGRTQALYVPQDPLFNTDRIRIGALAVKAGVPTIHSAREFVEAGGLISYGPNFADLFRRAADYVDKILRGANPADLPVQQPTKFDLLINLKTAKMLGLAISPTLLTLADEVIE